MMKLALGKEMDEVARELHLSQHTVKSHLSCMMRKTGARNRAHAVYLAVKYKLID